MRLQILGCAGGSAPRRQLTSTLIDGVLAIDAGALTTALEVFEQRAVRAVLISHSHLDHIWSLPLFLANRFDGATRTCEVHANEATLEAISEHQLNNKVWPDFTRAVSRTGPVLDMQRLGPGETRTVLSRYEVTTVPMNHAVPCQGHLVRTEMGSVLVGADTYAGSELITAANAADDLRALVMECSFPNDYDDLAKRSKHLTPRLFGEELEALKQDVPVYVTHMKPGYEDALRSELEALGDKRLRYLVQGETLEFPKRA